jgi:S-formylglutathione hydrolase FrmB
MLSSRPSTVGGGVRVVAVRELDERQIDLTIDSPAVGMQSVRLLLPTRYRERPDARWPVLYLLHGCCSDHTSWTTWTDIEAMTAGEDILVVMPDAGAWGWYSDWWNDGSGGPPMWETFHLAELLPLLERDWRAGDRRAVAGVSMGGLGAMSYAARHPGLFVAAASFSGMLETQAPFFRPGGAIWGDRVEQSANWAAHDPVSLAPALGGVALYVSYGSGGQTGGGRIVEDLEQWFAGINERWLVSGNEAFVARLEELGIPVTVDAGPGTHSWPYWERALRRSLPLLLGALGA